MPGVAIVHVAGPLVVLRTTDGQWVTAQTISQPISGWERHHEAMIERYRERPLTGQQVAVSLSGIPIWQIETSTGMPIDAVPILAGTSIPRVGVETAAATKIYECVQQARDDGAGAWRYAVQGHIGLLPEDAAATSRAPDGHHPLYTGILIATGVVFLIAIILHQGRRAVQPGQVNTSDTNEPKPQQKVGIVRRVGRGMAWYAGLWNPYRRG